MKDPTERAAILGTAASAALGEGCAIADPLVNALAVAHTCPLPPLPSTFPFRLEDGELARLGAVDYLILNIVLRSLIAAQRARRVGPVSDPGFHPFGGDKSR